LCASSADAGERNNRPICFAKIYRFFYFADRQLAGAQRCRRAIERIGRAAAGARRPQQPKKTI
jgi:hypothetical protein